MTRSQLIARAALAATLIAALGAAPALAAKPLDTFEAHPPIHVKGPVNALGHGAGPNRGGGGGVTNPTPVGYAPAAIKAAYGLPTDLTAGAGTVIAIVDAYDNPNVEKDLNTFSTQFGLPACTSGNGCFEKYLMAPRIKSDQGWGLEAALDTQWAHAIAPSAKILLVVARSASGNDLLAAVDYARSHGATAVSMSWGADEFLGEASYDSHFTGPAFFASSGDAGAGVSWPAVSRNVVGVGGTTLASSSETAWSGSGGGVSKYVSAPAYQASLALSGRAVPDVSYNADPNTGFAVYDTLGYAGQTGWFQVGGTSAGAPQWAAIYAIGATATNARLYADAADPALYPSKLRDIIAGTNGFAATVGYDLATGLGSPLTTAF
jgi:subtilase family serine protease